MSKVYVYTRVSTEKQELTQQLNTINDYLASKHLQADEVVSDERVSGGVSYKQRKLNDLINDMTEGDCLVVSEISRLGRSMSDLNKLVNDELKPRKLRLIIIKMGLDLDCSKLTPIDQMILMAFGFASELEKQMIQDRTQSALDARKKQIAEQGYFVAKKSGEKRTKLGNNRNAMPEAQKAAAEQRTAKAKANAQNIFLWRFMSQQADRALTAENVDKFVSSLNAFGATTSTGLPYTPLRFRAMWTKVQALYVS